MLELKDVSYYYKSQKDKTILDHVNYQISNPHFKWGSNFNPSGVFLWFRQRRDFAVPFLLVAS